MAQEHSISMLCIYRIKPGKEAAFLPLLEKHWPTLDGVGLVSPEPARWYRGQNKDQKTFFVEMFEWKDSSSPNVAHQTPEVMSVWEPMGALVEEMEFIQLDRGESRQKAS